MPFPSGEQDAAHASTSALEDRSTLIHRRASHSSLPDVSGDETSDPGTSHSLVDSLDLATSLPYWFAYARARMSDYIKDMEHLVYANKAHRMSILVPLEYMEARFSAAYDAMLRMAQEASFSRYEGKEASRCKLSSSDKIKHRIHVLVQEWERRAMTLQPTLFARTPTSESEKTQSSLRLPATAAYLSEEVQKSMSAMRNHFQNVTIPLLRDTSSAWAHDAQAFLPDRATLHHLPQHVRETLAMLGSRGMEAGAQIVHAVHDVEDAIYEAACRLANNGRELISYHALPQLWRNNDFIVTGYRFIPKEQWHRLILSAFHIHNETGNIHTHLGGLFLVGALFWLTSSLDPTTTTTMDRWIVTIYLFAAAKCLICSVSWHIMAGCADLQWFTCFACIDYTGISWLVAASLETIVYNGFYCQPGLIALYTVGVIAIGVIMSILPWSSWFNDIRYRTIRITLFLGMACMGIVPFVHGTILHGYDNMAQFYAPLIPSLGSYIVGVVLYSFRWPERWAPGKFDIVGHSHQLWHVAIVLAIYLHFQAVLSFHENRHAYSCAAGSTPSPTLAHIADIFHTSQQWLVLSAKKFTPGAYYIQ